MRKWIPVLTLALLSLASAQFSQQTKFNFKFPTYIAVFTNVTDVYFFETYDSSTTTTEGALVAGGVSGYYSSTATGIVECLENSTSSLPNTYEINGNDTNKSLYCNFAPNNVSKSGFSVTGYSSAATPPTDGELLIITNSGSYKVWGSSSDSLTSATIYAIPGYVTSSGTVQKANTSTSDMALPGNSTSAYFSQSDAYATQYSFAKIIPLLFYASVDVLNTSEITTAETMTITWEGSAQ